MNKHKITGPVYPILPAFNEDHEIDFSAVAKYVEYLNSFDVKTLMVTIGTSRFNLLSEKEMKQFNKKVIEANNNKSYCIVASPAVGSTKTIIEFAQQAESDGADAILVYYPERYYNDDDVFDFFQDVCDSVSIDVLWHGNPVRNATTIGPKMVNFSMDLFERLSSIKNFVGLKEESGNEEYRFKLATQFSDKLSIIVAGGSMKKFLSCTLSGVDSFLVGVGSFIPKVEEDFFEHIKKKEHDKALDIVKKYETPFFNVSGPMGWHLAMKAALYTMDLMPITERPPLKQASDKTIEKVREVLKQTNLLNY